MTTQLDIIIVNYNTWPLVAGCLAGLRDTPPSLPHHICVVDNASTDSSVTLLSKEWADVEIVRLAENVGFAAANNIGIRRTSSPLILLLNSDTIVPAGSIDRLVERLEASGAVAAGPRLIDATLSPEVSFGPMLSPLAEAMQGIRVKLASRKARWAKRYIAKHVSRERDVDWVSGACLLVRRTAAEEAGLLDERFFMYEEDVDFCASLRARGGRILFTPAAEVLHLRGSSFAATATPVSPLYDRSHLRFYEKHAPHWAPLLKAWLALRGRAIR
ncbi:MAG TPA: glycosyltransferase family 2 protein [Vicinamibacterales bacterium]|nr:glycosyltransferase family 2 protein [Vicinamibacterales bacterium]